MPWVRCAEGEHAVGVGGECTARAIGSEDGEVEGKIPLEQGEKEMASVVRTALGREGEEKKKRSRNLKKPRKKRENLKKLDGKPMKKRENLKK